jgi:transcriptional regulator with XRE-family HTH domain
MTSDIMDATFSERYARAVSRETNATAPLDSMERPHPIGALVRSWRSARGKSQLALSLEAGISTRHLSCVETGRANPSREMVLTLADALEVPLRERNGWLEAAGYVAAYRETPLDAPAMTEVRGALEHILAGHEPNPAFVVNRRYDSLLANRAAGALLRHFAPEWRGPANLLLMLLDPAGLRDSVVNWEEICWHVAHRVRAELSLGPRTPDDTRILERSVTALRELGRAPLERLRPTVVVPLKLKRGEVALDLFTTITTLGTPLDITLQELRIETLFPIDEPARRALAQWSERGCSPVSRG